MKPHEDQAHTTRRAKMAKVSGSAKNFCSEADKADRLARGDAKADSFDKYQGYAQAGEQ